MQHDKHELSSVDHFISTVKNRQHPTNRVVLWNNTWYHITQFEYKNNTMAIGSDEFQYTKLALAAENLASVALQLKIKLPTKNKWPTMYLHDKKSCWIFRTQVSKRSVPILSFRNDSFMLTRFLISDRELLRYSHSPDVYVIYFSATKQKPINITTSFLKHTVKYIISVNVSILVIRSCFWNTV